jgi:polyisoprenoid-binding protein YceI
MSSGRWRALAILTATMAASALPAASAGTYTIDPRDTTANFDLRFLGLIPLEGRFLRTSGTLVYDRPTRQGRIDVRIDATTLVSDNARAQALARGPEFFDVEKYPSIEFRSSRFVFDASRLKFIEGSLTLVGTTQPVVLTVTDSRCDIAIEQAAGRCHAAAELVVRRSAFGIRAWAHTVSEEVTIRIGITARQALEREPRPGPPDIDARTEPAVLPGGR